MAADAPKHEPTPLDLAARALRSRDRSRREIDDRLARRGIDDAARGEAIERLEALGYLDDGRFAANRAAALAGRGYGDAWIAHDLESHGIPREEADGAIAALRPERERADALVAQLGRGPRTAARLARKGFSEDAVEAAGGAFAEDGGGT